MRMSEIPGFELIPARECRAGDIVGLWQESRVVIGVAIVRYDMNGNATGLDWEPVVPFSEQAGYVPLLRDHADVFYNHVFRMKPQSFLTIRDLTE